MELTQKIFSGEQLEFLKSISPKLSTLIGSADSKTIKADDIFKGVNSKKKFYLFIGILFFDRQPLILKQKFNWKIRTNLTTKDELESILKEAGIKDTKAIFERAKKHYEEVEKAKTAPKAAPVRKGKAEHSKWAQEEERERRAREKFAETMRAEQAERNAYRAAFMRESAEGWAKQFPGKPYPSDPGWQWNHHDKKWNYYKAESNPFYNNDYMFGRASRPRAEAPPPPRPSRRETRGCTELLEEKRILVPGDTPKDTKRKWLLWALEHHPDKGGDTTMFQEVSNCYDNLVKEKASGGRRTRKQKRT